MTTPWQPAGEWTGETVAVLASGPSMNADVARALGEHRCIAVNYAIRVVPFADMLVALDGHWCQELRDFAGVKVTAVADDTLDALYIGPQWRTVQVAPGHALEITNSGLSAVELAARLGAARIILAGFDHPHQCGHFYDDVVEPYTGLEIAMRELIARLRAQGVTVEYFEPEEING